MNTRESNQPLTTPVVSVREIGVQFGVTLVPYKTARMTGFCRKEIGLLFGLHPKSIKRLEARCASLVRGRDQKNKRVLHYTAESIVGCARDEARRIDFLKAIQLGFPLDAVPEGMFGLPASGVNDGDSRLEPVSRELATQVLSAWSNWQLKQRRVEILQCDVPTLDAGTVGAIAAMSQTMVTDEVVEHWARMSGQSAAAIRGGVGRVRRHLQKLLSSPKGRLVLTVLFGGVCN